MEFCNNKLLFLIKLYRERPRLWDNKHNEFKVQSKKIIDWNEIAAALECDDVDEVKRKMGSLLSSFRRERQRYEAKKAAGKAYESKWFAFDAMSFLLGKFTRRKRLRIRKNHNELIRFKKGRNVTQIKKSDNIIFEGKEDITPQKIPVVEKQRDDFQIFSDYVASEFRALKSEENRRLLRLKIQRAILEVADIENQQTNVTSSVRAYTLSPSIAIQLKEEEI